MNIVSSSRSIIGFTYICCVYDHCIYWIYCHIFLLESPIRISSNSVGVTARVRVVSVDPERFYHAEYCWVKIKWRNYFGGRRKSPLVNIRCLVRARKMARIRRECGRRMFTDDHTRLKWNIEGVSRRFLLPICSKITRNRNSWFLPSTTSCVTIRTKKTAIVGESVVFECARVALLSTNTIIIETLFDNIGQINNRTQASKVEGARVGDGYVSKW